MLFGNRGGKIAYLRWYSKRIFPRFKTLISTETEHCEWTENGKTNEICLKHKRWTVFWFLFVCNLFALNIFSIWSFIVCFVFGRQMYCVTQRTNRCTNYVHHHKKNIQQQLNNSVYFSIFLRRIFIYDIFYNRTHTKNELYKKKMSSCDRCKKSNAMLIHHLLDKMQFHMKCHHACWCCCCRQIFAISERVKRNWRN